MYLKSESEDLILYLRVLKKNQQKNKKQQNSPPPKKKTNKNETCFYDSDELILKDIQK